MQCCPTAYTMLLCQRTQRLSANHEEGTYDYHTQVVKFFFNFFYPALGADNLIPSVATLKRSPKRLGNACQSLKNNLLHVLDTQDNRKEILPTVAVSHA